MIDFRGTSRRRVRATCPITHGDHPHPVVERPDPKRRRWRRRCNRASGGPSAIDGTARMYVNASTPR